MKESNIVLIKYTEEKTKGDTQELTIQRHRQYWNKPQNEKKKKSTRITKKSKKMSTWGLMLSHKQNALY